MIKYTAPNFVDINITNNCNMNCTHCYIGEQPLNEMTLNQGLDYIKQLQNLGVFKVSLTGGEPLLHPNLIDFIQEIGACDMEPMVNTNGVLFNDKIIDDLDKVLSSDKMLIAISLDGLGDEEYIQLRKWKDGTDALGAFDLIINNATKLMERGYKVVFNFTYTNLNKDNLFNLYYFLEEQYQNYSFLLNVILFGMSGNGNKNRNQLSVQYNEWKTALNHIMELKLSNNLKYLKVEPTCPWEIYVPLEKYSYEIIEKEIRYVSPLRSPFYSKFRDVGCHAGITNIVINWNGEIYPCGLYPVNNELCLGNLKEQSLKNIWDNSTLLTKIRNIKLTDLDSECQKCNFSGICGGGCRGASIQLEEGLYGKDMRCPILNEEKL